MGIPGNTGRNKRFAFRVSMLLFLAGLAWYSLTGCKSVSFTPYVSPRITGRIVHADTREPISGVRVWRSSSEVRHGLDQPKGGQLLDQPGAATSDRDGEFVLPSLRSLSPFRKSGWYSATVFFERTGFEKQSQTFTLPAATNNASGEPVIFAGDISLTPTKKKARKE